MTVRIAAAVCLGRRGDDGSEAGFATVALPMLLWVAALVAVVAIDITGYLAAASRAQALADAAALAAVVPGIPGASALSPTAEAERVVDAGDGRLESCVCPLGSQRVEVRVSVIVPGLVIPTLGAGRVAADAHAVLVPPEAFAPGPTRERARWSHRADPETGVGSSFGRTIEGPIGRIASAP